MSFPIEIIKIYNIKGIKEKFGRSLFYSPKKEKLLNGIEFAEVNVPNITLWLKVNGQFSDSFSILKGVRQGCPLSPIHFNRSINDFFNDCLNNSVKIDTEYCCGELFADNIVFCTPSSSCMNKLLRSVGKCAKDNMTTFGINKCTTFAVEHEKSKFIHREDSTFYLSGIAISKTNSYTYLGYSFSQNS
ncbi:hypothetical protein BCR32DRAFT_288402 [Anaeromyces robustus]|uniref:Reverse transcriptase domain-containing protein n=1 Tax=Anaeromyces robustus TaxID=1754192 RepID=A0A1Y1UWD2_9FUNG|nr:hypothetical protein BCR32DRAFT_288402 [Anaeromyces robustus]|eukprot:ORX42356.1 hypothetical protein BCR32DRAFT_288402 [Anaeromyces robustus]